MAARKTLELLTRTGVLGLAILANNCRHTRAPHEWSYLMGQTERIANENPVALEQISQVIEEEAVKYRGMPGDKMSYVSPHQYSTTVAVDLMSTNLKSRLEAEKRFMKIVIGYQSINKRTEQTLIGQVKSDVEGIIKSNKELLELYSKSAGLKGGEENCILHSIITLCALTGRAAEEMQARNIDKYEIELVNGIEYHKSIKQFRVGHQWVVAENQVIDRFSPPVKNERYLIPLVGSKITLRLKNKGIVNIESQPKVYTLPHDYANKSMLAAN